MSSSNFLVDLSLVTPPKKVFRLVGGDNPVDVDISVFPARAMLKFMHVMQSHTDKSAPSLEEMVSVVAEACKPKNPEIDDEWLMDNMTFSQLTDFCSLVMEYGNGQLRDYQKKFSPKQTEGEGKNSPSASSSHTSAKSTHGQRQTTASKK